MDADAWSLVDAYLCDALVGEQPALDAALSRAHKAGLPAIEVTPNQGKFLHLLARIRGARRILEVGTLGGYSTLWLARALPPDGRLVTLELDPKHAAVARENLASFGDVVEVRVGRAVDSLDTLIAAGTEPFDFVFIDADKPSNPDYFTRALRLARAGSVIVVDNIVRHGRVLDTSGTMPDVEGVRRLHTLIQNEPRVDATALQTVGTKGWDGFTIALVIA